MKKISHLASSVVFVVLGVFFLIVLNKVLTPTPEENTEVTLKGFRSVSEEVEVLFVGTSVVEFGVSPMTIYEQTEIRAYSLGTSAQPFELSYYLLEDAIANGASPDVIMLEVSSIFTVFRTGFWRRVMDCIPLSKTKVKMIEEYQYNTADTPDPVLTVYLPFIKYHTRWSSLTQDDFSRCPNTYYSAGQYIDNQIASTTYPMEAIESELAYMMTQKGFELGVPKPVSEHIVSYLEKYVKLCEAHNIKLILFKMPQHVSPLLFQDTWTREKRAATYQLAKDYGLDFYDLHYDYLEETGIDWTTDSKDAGIHLNANGAEKISIFLARMLADVYGVQGGHTEAYDQMYEEYSELRDIWKLNMCTDFIDYLGMLKEHQDRLSLFFVARDDITTGLCEEAYAALTELGLENIASIAFRDSYAAALDAGKLLFEGNSFYAVEYTGPFQDGEFSIRSVGAYAGGKTSITINEELYDMEWRGLNIVVYDNDNHIVLDCVNYDTVQSTCPCHRSGQLARYRSVEKRLAFS